MSVTEESHVFVVQSFFGSLLTLFGGLVEVLSALLVYLSIERDESEEDTVANVLLLHSGLNKTASYYNRRKIMT